MLWQREKNTYLWSKESNKARSLYTNLCTSRLNDIQWLKPIKSDTLSKMKCIQGKVEITSKKAAVAVDSYCQALLYAESNSQISFCFLRRAQCFLLVQKFKECLIDLDLAISYGDTHLDEINDTKNACLITQFELHDKSEVDDKSVELPTLSYAEHENYPGVSKQLEFHMNKKDEIHVISNDDIEVGKIIVMEECFMFHTGFGKERCIKCFKIYSNFIPCKKCSIGCSCISCENSAVHKLECGMEIPDIDGFMEKYAIVIRSIHAVISIFKDANELMKFVEDIINDKQQKKIVTETINVKSKYEIFLRHFDKNRPKESIKTKKTIHIIYNMLMANPIIAEMFSKKYHKRFLMHLIGHHMSVTKKMSIYKKEIKTRLIPATTSYFNHSCKPNALLSLYDNKMIIVSVLPIKKGDQITLSYIGLHATDTYDLRQEELKKFGFKCWCNLCNMQLNNEVIPRTFLTNKQRKVMANKNNVVDYKGENREKMIKLLTQLLNTHGNEPYCDDLSLCLTFYYLLIQTKHLLQSILTSSDE